MKTFFGNTFFGKTWEDWIAEYAESHQHPINRLCHSFGIPLIVLSLPIMLFGILWPEVFWTGLILFVVGWVLQFVGHAYERKPPEFFRDWRFLFVGLRWWFAKIKGKV
jgi:uncharacterized membrane protein YGL010W